MNLESLVIYLALGLIGYGIGRRVGLKEGYKRGIERSPLILRMKLLENGKCMICDNKIE